MTQDRKDHKNMSDTWEKNKNYSTLCEPDEVVYPYKNPHIPNVIDTINVHISKRHGIMINAYRSDYYMEADSALNPYPEALCKTCEDARFKQHFNYIVTSNFQKDPEQIIKFLNILNKFEKFDRSTILQDTGVLDLLKVKNVLFSAATNGDAKAIAKAIDEMKKFDTPIDINRIRNSRGETLLMLAASGNRNMPHGQSHEAVRLLLENGADPLATSNDGRTVLMEATNFGRLSVVTLLLDSIPLEKRIPYINQKDNVSKSAKDYAGQLGHFINVQKQIGDLLDKRIELTQTETLTASNSAPFPTKK